MYNYMDILTSRPMNDIKKQAMQHQKSELIQKLKDWNIQLEGDWTHAEIERVLRIFENLAAYVNIDFLTKMFNNQPTFLHHSGRPGKAGRTKGGEIYLDDDWTDWTFAHELGHRWNNAWNRLPEQILRLATNAGRFEWIKGTLRRFEKWLECTLKRFNLKGRFDWHKLWYTPGNAPPPCGVDRNFNASEDLAESFASMVFPLEAKDRASKAADRMIKISGKWDWGNQFEDFLETPRGKTVLQMLKTLLPKEQYLNEPNQPANEDQPGRV